MVAKRCALPDGAGISPAYSRVARAVQTIRDVCGVSSEPENGRSVKSQGVHRTARCRSNSSIQVSRDDSNRIARSMLERWLVSLFLAKL
jgi:hypothetical protein